MLCLYVVSPRHVFTSQMNRETRNKVVDIAERRWRWVRDVVCRTDRLGANRFSSGVHWKSDSGVTVPTWHSCGPIRLILSSTGRNSWISPSNRRMSSSRGSTACRQDSAADIHSVRLRKNNILQNKYYKNHHA